MIGEFTSKIQEQPEHFFTDYLGVDPWEKQMEVVHSVRDNRKTTVRSNNGAGKTFIMARVGLWFLFAYAPAVVINTAPTHRQVENQYWREFRRAHNNAVRPLGGKLLKTQYNVDEDWFALGFSTQDGEAGMEKFQGWHGENMLYLIDEASGIHPSVVEAIEGGMGGTGTMRFVMIGNPTRNSGDFAASFKDPGFNKIHISAFDVPNVKQKKIIVPGLATHEWVKEMETKYGKDSDVYRVRVLGQFPKKESGTLIGVDLVEDAIDAERELYGEEHVIGLDPARYGEDTSAFVERLGNWAKVLEEIQGEDTMQIAGRAKIYLMDNPNAVLRIDITGGLGAGIFDRLKEQPEVADRVQGVNVAASPIDKERYLNLRSEGWHVIKDWLRDAVLEKHEGWYELSQPKYKIMSSGKVALESKDEMKKRGVKSPNVGDALVLTVQRPTEGGSIEFLMA